MENNIYPVIVEKLNVSDENYKISDIYFNNGDKVQKGDIILCVETSKAAVDIETENEGYVFYNIELNEKVVIGDLLAAVSESESFNIKKWFSSFKTPKEQGSSNLSKSQESIRISKSARKLIEDNKINIAVFKNTSF